MSSNPQKVADQQPLPAEPALPNELLKDAKNGINFLQKITLAPNTALVTLLDAYLIHQHNGTLDASCHEFIESVIFPLIETVMSAQNTSYWTYNLHFHNLFPKLFTALTPLIPNGDEKLLTAIQQMSQFQNGFYNADEASQSLDQVTKEEEFVAWPRAGSRYGYLVDCGNAMGKCGVFDALLALAQNPKTPIGSVFICVSVMNGFGFLPVESTFFKYMLPFFTEVEKRLGNEGEYDKQVMNQLVQAIPYDPSSIIESTHLGFSSFLDDKPRRHAINFRIAFYMFKSNAFNAKMYGLNILRSFCKSKNAAAVLAPWLRTHKLIKEWFSVNLHQRSYVSRIEDILQTLAVSGKLTTEDIDLIWKAQEGKHEAVVKNIHNLFIGSAMNFHPEILDRVFEIVKENWGQSEKSDQKLLSLLHKMAEKDYGGSLATRVMNLLWSLAHNQETSKEMATNSIQALIDIIRNQGDDERNKYIYLSYDDLKNKHWVVPALETIAALLELVPDIKRDAVNKKDRKTEREVMLMNLISDGLEDTVLDFMQGYQTLVKNEVKKLALGPGGDDTTLSSNVFFESSTHGETMSSLRKFFSFTVSERTIFINESFTRKLWDVLIEGAPTKQDLNDNYDWYFNRLNHNSVVDVGSKGMIMLMEAKVGTMDAETMHEKAVSCAIEIFYNINTTSNALITSNRFKVKNLNEVKYLDVLFRIATNHTSQMCADLAISTLIRIFTSATISEDHQFQFLTDRICTITSALDDPSLSEERRERCGVRSLQLLRKFIVAFDHDFKEHRIHPSITCHFNGFPVTIFFNIAASFQEKNFTKLFTSSTPMYELRRCVASYCGLSYRDFDITFNKVKITSPNKLKPLSAIGLAGERTVFVKTSNNGWSWPSEETLEGVELVLPSCILTQNEDFSVAFDKILHCNNDAIRRTAQQLSLLLPTDVHKFTRLCNSLCEGISLDDGNDPFTPLFLSEDSFTSCYNILLLCVLLRHPTPFTHERVEDQKVLVLDHFNLNVFFNVLDWLKEKLLEDLVLFERELYVTTARSCLLLLFNYVEALDNFLCDTEKVIRIVDEKVDGNRLLVCLNSYLMGCCCESTGFGSKSSLGRSALSKLNEGLMHDTLSVLEVYFERTSNLANTFMEQLDHHKLEALIAHNSFATPRKRFIRLLTNRVNSCENGCALLIESMMQLLTEEDGFPSSSDDFFNLFELLVKKMDVVGSETENDPIMKLMLVQVNWLRSFAKSPPKTQSEIDDLQSELAGRLRVCCVVARKYPHVLQICEGMHALLLADMLFSSSRKLTVLSYGDELPDDLSVVPALCSHRSVRHHAFNFLIVMVENNINLFDDIQGVLSDFHFRDEFEIKEENYTPVIEGRPRGSFIGLKNACATCYMNSVLQQLFMQPDLCQLMCGGIPINVHGSWHQLCDLFHKTSQHTNLPTLEDKNPSDSTPQNSNNKIGDGVGDGEIKDKDVSSTPSEGDNANGSVNNKDPGLLSHVVNMFGHMKYSDRKYFAPRGIWKTYKHWGTPVNVREQQDACEFFNCLIDQMDEGLHKCQKTKLFSQMFGGMFTDQKIVKEGCSHRYEREEPFMNMSLNVTHCDNLLDSLENYVQGEELEGYRCEKCDEKRTITKRTCIKSAPRVLVFQLKRFDFDWERGVPVKFNNHFEFGDDLDIGPFTAQGMAVKEGGEGEIPNVPYRLCGVVVHSGQANGGHYYSFARNRHPDMGEKDAWFKFDDADVTEIDYTNAASMSTDWFGGIVTQSVFDNKLQRYVEKQRARWWNAYMLFYERVTPEPFVQSIPKKAKRCDEQQQSIDTASTSAAATTTTTTITTATTTTTTTTTTTMPKQEGEGLEKEEPCISPIDPSTNMQLKLEVVYDNILSMREREVFNPHFFSFVQRLVGEVAREAKASLAEGQTQISDQTANEYIVNAMKIGITFLYNYVFVTDDALRSNLALWATTMKDMFEISSSARSEFANSLSSNRICRFLLWSSDDDGRRLFKNLIWSCVYNILVHDDRVVGMLLMNKIMKEVQDSLDKAFQLFALHTFEYLELVKDYSLLGSQFRKEIVYCGVLATTKSILALTTPQTNAQLAPPLCKLAIEVLAVFVLTTDMHIFREALPDDMKDKIDTPEWIENCDPAVGGTNDLLPAEVFFENFRPTFFDIIRATLLYHPLFELSPFFARHVAFCCEQYSLNVVQVLCLGVDTFHFYDSPKYLSLLKHVLNINDSLALVRIQKTFLDINDDCGLFRVINFCRSSFDKKSYVGLNFLIWCLQENTVYSDFLLGVDALHQWSWARKWLDLRLRSAFDDVDSNMDSQEYGLQRSASVLQLQHALSSVLPEAVPLVDRNMTANGDIGDDESDDEDEDDEDENLHVNNKNNAIHNGVGNNSDGDESDEGGVVNGVDNGAVAGGELLPNKNVVGSSEPMDDEDDDAITSVDV
eukprot:m.46576 g.46576  ORF g.46576 m.46576 type:complete len:2422 (-) comp7278_c0_seq1:386-7651(-)